MRSDCCRDCYMAQCECAASGWQCLATRRRRGTCEILTLIFVISRLHNVALLPVGAVATLLQRPLLLAALYG
jgi:hypothetical protein